MIVILEMLGNYASVRLAFSTSPDMRDPVWSDPVATSERRARVTVPALADGDYYYFVELDGRYRRNPNGKIRVKSSASYRFAFCGDRRTLTNTDTLDVMMATDPDFVMWIGDMHYSDNFTNTEEAVARTFRNARNCKDLQTLLANFAVPYMWDDHDSGPNDGDSTAPAVESAHKVFRKMVPQTLADITADAPVYYTFQRGRVLFIVTDLRTTRSALGGTDNSGKSMLGAAQKTWFKNVLAAPENADKVFVWINTIPWVGAKSTSSDGWWRYDTERNELANYIKTHAAGRIAILSTDMHCIAYDDGTNSDYATGGGAAMPVCHAAPINQSNSVRGGPYLVGPYDSHNGQWGEITVSDTGTSTISFNFKAYRNHSGIPLGMLDETFNLMIP